MVSLAPLAGGQIGWITFSPSALMKPLEIEMQLVTVDEVMSVQGYHSQSVIDRMTEQKESSYRGGRPLALQAMSKKVQLALPWA